MAGEARPVSGKGAVLAGALAAALAVAGFVKPWEGRELVPYRDIVGVWTVCEGITRNVEQRRYTNEECDALLRDEVVIHLRGVAKCIRQPLAQNEWVAIGSWAYNVGVSAACRSTLVRKINAGQPWCAQLLLWDYAGGKRVRGLTLRRRAEFDMCEGRA